jgi:hypothetical protein
MSNKEKVAIKSGLIAAFFVTVAVLFITADIEYTTEVRAWIVVFYAFFIGFTIAFSTINVKD